MNMSSLWARYPGTGVEQVRSREASIRLGGRSGFSAKRAVGWSAAVGFAALVAGTLAHGSGQVFPLIYPGLALLVGVILYLCHPTLYLGFTWWLWFLTPEVRRIVDYQIGWNPISPVMVAPYLVAGVAALTLLRSLPQMLQRPRLFPFLLVLMGLNYGYTIGLVRAGPAPATYALLDWIVPVAFGFHMAAHWQQYPLYRDAMQRVFLWGVLAMGIYGIVQFYVVPPWDAYWMEVAPIGSIGWPQPFEVRVWSTMNAPLPFGVVMMAGLLFTFAATGPLRFVAAVPGYLSFLLCLVRTAWFGWAIGVLFMLVSIRGVQKMKLLAVAALVGLLSLPLLLLEPVAETVTSRFESMQELREDTSYRARLRLYRDMLLLSATNVIGEGLGATGLATKLANAGEPGLIFDSGVLDFMFVLGWPGTILYVGGLIWLLANAFDTPAWHQNLAVHAARAIVLATLAMHLSLNMLTGVAGMVFWSFLGLALGAATFHRDQGEAPAG
jgi:hypothetical protein